MPRVNIYIRNEDWDKWQAIEDKPVWLHDHLMLNKPKIIEVDDDADNTPLYNDTCKHGAAKGFCKHGC